MKHETDQYATKKTQTNKKNYIVKAQVIQAIFEIPIHFNIRSSLSNIVDREVINLSSQAYQCFPALRDGAVTTVLVPPAVTRPEDAPDGCLLSER